MGYLFSVQSPTDHAFSFHVSWHAPSSSDMKNSYFLSFDRIQLGKNTAFVIGYYGSWHAWFDASGNGRSILLRKSTLRQNCPSTLDNLANAHGLEPFETNILHSNTSADLKKSEKTADKNLRRRSEQFFGELCRKLKGRLSQNFP